jgi:hypothetical protein
MNGRDQFRMQTGGMTAFGIFLLWGATMASLAGTTLTWPGTVLDRVWVLNPTGYKQLSPFGSKAGILFITLAVVLAAAGIGWLKRLLWAWRLSIAIIATQVLGNIVNIMLGRTVEAGVGLIVSGALLFYLSRGRVRSAFNRPARASCNRDLGGQSSSSD